MSPAGPVINVDIVTIWLGSVGLFRMCSTKFNIASPLWLWWSRQSCIHYRNRKFRDPWEEKGRTSATLALPAAPTRGQYLIHMQILDPGNQSVVRGHRRRFSLLQPKFPFSWGTLASRCVAWKNQKMESSGRCKGLNSVWPSSQMFSCLVLDSHPKSYWKHAIYEHTYRRYIATWDGPT